MAPGHPIDPHATRILPLWSDVPIAARPWVDLPGSMTAEIGVLLGQVPRVEPIREGPSRGVRWEIDLLGSRRRPVYAREVVLRVNGESVLLARTLTFRDDPAVRVLRRLKRQPLAEVLFQDERWRRVCPPLALEMRDRASRIPGRVSLWHNRSVSNSRLLVEEYFLEPLLIGTTRS